MDDIYADFKRSWGTQAWVVAYIYPPFFALVLAPSPPSACWPRRASGCCWSRRPSRLRCFSCFAFTPS